ncbi:sulfatase family protein [Jiangella asiatica]|uniref:Arylsulfatase n=1 Tax=Jiangella asiatica TaxID=2530372 RepID=A0A4R5DK56_9ACTN|nr:arylsulfatase [Jiangella asiatica]TDE11225.1 arylsulfatase [Jiangella asiatica]
MPRSHTNVVLVLADDLGWGDLGCYGATRIRTPAVDRLAAEGVSFHDAHAASAVCTPSRYALMTGRYSWRSPLKSGVLMGHGPALIEPGRPTLGSVFQEHGYRTAAIGKWHLGLGWRHRDDSTWDAFAGDPLEYELGDPLARHRDKDLDFGADIDYARPFTGGPVDLGFDYFFGIAGSLNMPPYALLRQDRTLGLPQQEKRRFLPGQRPGLETRDWDEREVDLRFTAEAVRFIEHSAGEPFLLYFAPSAPHRPQVPPDFLRGSSEAGVRGDSVVFVDWMVGQVTEALERAGVLDDTLVIFTSDNGAPTIFADEVDLDVHRPNGPWRGQKGDLWDGGHREPLVMRLPGVLPAGATSATPIGLIDLMPSLAGLLDLPLPPGAAPDGTDRSAQLRGAPGSPGDVLVHHSMGGAFAVTRGRWKAIFSTGSGGGLSGPGGEPVGPDDPAGQLFDLDADPGEQHNAWLDHPDVVHDLYRRLIDLAGHDLDPHHGESPTHPDQRRFA